MRWPWKRKSREPFTLDACEVCGIRLRASERVEIMAWAPRRDPGGGLGGGGVSATYCKAHAPQEAA